MQRSSARCLTNSLVQHRQSLKVSPNSSKQTGELIRGQTLVQLQLPFTQSIPKYNGSKFILSQIVITLTKVIL